MSVGLRRAEPGDVDFLAGLLAHEEVEPYLAPLRAKDAAAIRAKVERARREPAQLGVLVIEVDGWRAGTVRYEATPGRSRIANLGALAIHPDFRGRRLGEEAARLLQRELLLGLGFHRLQLEIYAFNERAIRHAERAGFVREGTRRKAYWRHGAWQDSVLFGLVREDLGLHPAVDVLYELVARLGLGLRCDDWEPLAESFAVDAELVVEGAAAGPVAGRDAILAACRERPPDDEVRLVDAEPTAEGAAGRFAWASAPGTPAGRLVATLRGGLVERLVVTVEAA